MPNAKPLPPIEQLRELLSYDPATGALTWATRRKGGCKPGQPAGCVSPTGYGRILCMGKSYPTHRIAWALYHGEDPYPYQIDHIDRDKINNRIANLRLATPKENCANRYTSPEKGKRPNLYNYCGKKKSVRITYPDGRGSIVCDSIHTAATILNRHHQTVTNAIIIHGGHLHWGRGRSARPSGTTLEWTNTPEYN
jgi:hypothetical protein